MATDVSRPWRLLVTDLSGAGITLLDHLASDRTITPKLNEPLELTGTVPSDNPEVNRDGGDGYPALCEGVRQIYGFRLEPVSPSVSYYVVRASTLVLQVDDAAISDDARSRFTAFDPWQYLFLRPARRANSDVLIDPKGYIFPAGTPADVIVTDLLENMADWMETGSTPPGASADAFIDWGQTGFWTGTIETCADFSPDGYTVQQGASVGDVLQDICASGRMDIWLEPIYDPDNRPGYLCQLSIFSQSAPNDGMGDFNTSAVFAWDKPGRSLVGIDDLFDGTGRANVVQLYNGQGGPPVTRQNNIASINTYGEYWAQQFFPAQPSASPVEAMAAQQLALRKTFKQTLTVNPAPDRSPEPFIDYFLGDRVRIFASNNLRQDVPPSWDDTAWQRVYGIPIELDDNGVETVRELLVGPVGGPPPVGGIGTPAPALNAQVSITTARSTNRGGGIGQ